MQAVRGSVRRRRCAVELILITAVAAEAAGLDPASERRSLDLKGKELPTDVVSIKVTPD